MYEKILILEKAAEIFGEKGYYLATIEEVASRVNLKKTIIYKYFKNKDELFLELLNTASALRRREVFDTIGLTDDIREKLSRFIISLLRFARNQKNYYKILAEALTVSNPEIQTKLNQVREEFKDHVYQILQDGIRQGKFRIVNPLIMTAYLGKLIEGTVAIIEVEPNYSVDQMILTMLDMVWNGLAKKTETSVLPGIDEPPTNH
ncbi:MAG TPA: TetR/AcrR family transcriptional regulator [Bacillota bacterium]|nr:TetR/AcrR family transcriptional regulator [Bacillota bacterium]